MKVEIAKEMFNALIEEDKLHLIEKVMPYSGTYRQLDESGNWSDNQWILLASEFMNYDNWAKGLLMDKLDVHDSSHIVNGDSELGNPYEGIGYYSDNKLLFIEGLEYIGSKT